MATTGFQINGGDIGLWPDKSYLLDRYPELADNMKQAGLWSWGYNPYGQLGDNTLTNQSSPIQTIAGGTNWRQLSCGRDMSAAIKTDGTLWLWGVNTKGGLGNNSTQTKSSPVQTAAGGTNWKQVSLSSQGLHCAAIKTDGTLWLWGGNGYGELGNNSVVPKSSPVQTVAGGTNWKLVSCGGYFTGAIKTDGTLWLWGINRYGRLGNNVNNYSDRYSSPIQTIAGGTNWKLVACGFYSSAAIKTDGTLWTWGSNSGGQLGNGQIGSGWSTGAVYSPVQTIAGGTNWKQVSVGASNVSAIKTDGTLWCWGVGGQGANGNQSAANQSSPVQTVAGGTNWKFTSSGNYSTSAIKTDGTLWLWGYNNYGQLGDNTIVDKFSPVQTVASGNNWKLIAAAKYSRLAIRDDSSDPI